MFISMKLKNLKVSDFLVELENCFSSIDGIYEEMEKYAICKAGKRIRPTLIFLVAKAYNPSLELNEIMPACLMIENIHNYSLVHDDLPCMDNDEYRRGKLTVHKKFGEANAVLLGDKLLTNALSLAATIKYTSVIETISKAAKDMLDGQYIDVNRTNLVNIDDYLSLYEKKTGALMYASIVSGYLIGNSDKRDIDFPILEKFANCFGLAFQLYDDLSDEDENSAFSLGKEVVEAKFNEFKGIMNSCLDDKTFKELKEYINNIFNSKM